MRLSQRNIVYVKIDAERDRQDRKFGWMENPDSKMPNGSEYERLGVLAEEFGEVARAILEDDEEGREAELVQVAAVAVAWLEARRERAACAS